MILQLFRKKREKTRAEKVKILSEKYEHNLFVAANVKFFHDAGLAEEAVQETFKRLLQSKTEISEDGFERAYVLAVLENVCNDILKRKKKIETHEISDEYISGNYFSTPDDIVIGKELSEALREIIKKLDSTYREVLILKIVSEKNTKEISDILGISEENVRVRLHRARSIIYKELEKEGLVDARKK